MKNERTPLAKCFTEFMDLFVGFTIINNKINEKICKSQLFWTLYRKASRNQFVVGKLDEKYIERNLNYDEISADAKIIWQNKNSNYSIIPKSEAN